MLSIIRARLHRSRFRHDDLCHNITEGALSDEQLHRAIRAINRQIAEDFAPYWGFGAQLRLEGKTGATKAMTRSLGPQAPGELRSGRHAW